MGQLPGNCRADPLTHHGCAEPQTEETESPRLKGVSLIDSTQPRATSCDPVEVTKTAAMEGQGTTARGQTCVQRGSRQSSQLADAWAQLSELKAWVCHFLPE